MNTMPRPRIVIGNPYQRPDRNDTWYFTLFGNPVSLKTTDEVIAQDTWLKEYWMPYKQGKLRDPKMPGFYLKDVVSDFLNKTKALKEKRTWTGYKQRLNQFLAFIGNKPVADISKEDLINYKIKLRNENQKDKSINAQIVHLNALFNSFDWKDQKPPHKNNSEWKVTKYVQRDIELPSTFEKEVWLDWSKHIPEFREIMPLELFCGITANDFMFPICFEEDKIRLTRMKTNTRMYIPFSNELKKHIPHMIGKGWVQLWKWDIDNFNKKHYNIRLALGLERMTPHYFKHVFVSMAFEAGWPIKYISEMTGTTPDTLQKVYIHTLEKTKTEMMNNLNERLLA